MIQERFSIITADILKPFSYALLGLVGFTVFSLWLGQTLMALGTPQEELKLLFLAIILPPIFVGTAGVLILSYLPFPGFNGRIGHYVGHSTMKAFIAFITGLINTIIIAFLLNVPGINLFAIVFFLAFSAIGLSNVCRLIGDKLYEFSGDETNPIKSLLTGILLLEILMVLPFIGQFFAVVCLFTGLGGAIIALFVKKIKDLPAESV